MKTQPTISIVTPSFNQARYLTATIESVLDQNYPNLEYIVIDGGSTDNSEKILRKFDRYITSWKSEPDRGQSHALNKGFALATGQIMGWINADDTLESGACTNIGEILHDTTKPAWLIGGTRITNKWGFTIDERLPRPISQKTFYSWPSDWFPQQSTYWTRLMWNQVGPVREDLHYIMDCDLWARMFEISEPVFTEKILARYRMHERAKCVEQKEMVNKEYEDYVRSKIEKSLETCDSENTESKLNELLEEFMRAKRELWISEEKLERVRRHVVIGPLIKIWRLLINRQFDI